jgi:hypothetical protein
MGDLASLPDWERLLECPNAVPEVFKVVVASTVNAKPLV